MTLILGLMGIAQAIFLPGYIFVRRFARGVNAPLFFILAFGLSLFANYVLIMLFCAFQIYTRATLLFLFALELALCFLPPRPSEGPDPAPGPRGFMQGVATELSERPYVFAARAVALAVVAAALVFCVFQFGEIFTAWDAVVSWNKWAVDLSENFLPTATYNYPLLVPALFSIPYVLMGDSGIQFFSYAIALLFVPMGALAAYGIFRTRNYFSALGVLAAGGWFFFQVRNQVGYVDLPVAVVMLCSLTLLFEWRCRATCKSPERLVLFASIFSAAAAASIKQAGLFLVICYPLLLRDFSKDKKDVLKSVKGWKIALVCMFIVPLAWYVRTQYLIAVGENISEISYLLSDIHEGRSYFERVLHACRLHPVIFALFVLSLPALFYRESRVCGICALVCSLIWMCFFSYSSRNAAFAIPFLGLSAGYAVGKALTPAEGVFTAFLRTVFRKRTLWLSGLGVLCALAYFSRPVHALLVRKQHGKSLWSGPGKNFNTHMLELLREQPAKVATSYHPLPYLSGFPRELHVPIPSFNQKGDHGRIAEMLEELGTAYIYVSDGESGVRLEELPFLQNRLELLDEGYSFSLYRYTSGPREEKNAGEE